LAISLATRDDARLIGDIEKLTKKKIELEPFVLEDERPRWRKPVEADAPEDDGKAPAPRRPPRASSPPVPRDPLFDQPYEENTNASPAWEKAPVEPASPRGGLSRYIKPKRKLAALLTSSNKAS
jgi:ATP-dependent RNA helicase RhlE